MEPERSIWTTATRTRVSARGSRWEEGRDRRCGCRPGARGGRAGTRRSCEWACSRRPSGTRAAQSWRPRPPSRSGLPMSTGSPGGGSHARDTGRPPRSGRRPRCADRAGRRRCRVHDGVGHQLAGQHHGVVDDVAEAPALEGVTDKGTGARDGSSDGLEAGGRARGDHRTPRPVLDGHGPWPAGSCRWCGRPSVGRGSSGGCSPGISPVVMLCGRPSDARSFSCHRPGRTRRRGWTAACKVTYLRGPSGCRSAVFPSEVFAVRRVCGRCAKLPNCYGLVPRG